MRSGHVVLVAVGAGIAYYFAHPARTEITGSEARNVALSLNAPEGTATTEQNPAFKAAARPSAAVSAPGATGDWPSYNKTLTSERFSDLGQINTKNVGKLKVLCTYDIQRLTAFEDGLIMVEGALIGTTEFDIFSLDPATCAENWRTHEEYPGYLLPTNRRGLHGRPAVPRRGGRPRACLRLQNRQETLGGHDR
jgi:alcohol dehydrogenase (cytochrome c)